MKFTEFMTLTWKDVVSEIAKYPLVMEYLDLADKESVNGDYSSLKLNCYIWGTPTHIAANCPLVLIPERYQKTKDKWIASKAKPKRVECSENVPPPKTKVDAQASSYSAASRRFFFKVQKYKMSYEALQQSESLESNHRVF